MRILSCADAALLVELDDLAEVRVLHAVLARHPPPGVTETVPAARTVLLRLAPGTDPVAVRRAVLAARRSAAGAAAGAAVPDASPEEPVRIPVRYDGQDLAAVAELTHLTEPEVIAAHTGTVWTVAFCGFAPGFGYLTGGDTRLRVPRRAEPRLRVPAGSVALAGEYTAVYPGASPGGWRLIGTTDVPVWRVDRDPPALLRPGVRVHFTDAGR